MLPDPLPIPLEEVAAYPLPGMAFPTGLRFSPDDRLVTYLHAPQGGLVNQLYQFDPASGELRLLLSPPGEGVSEENLSLEEKLRRERQRLLTLGVTRYAWAELGTRLLLPLPGGLHLLDEPGGEPRLLVGDEAGPLLDPQLSPDGERLAYVQNAELYIISTAGGEAPRQLSFGARENGLTHGLAEYVAQEEMDRSRGFWWSPDSRYIAYTQVDERHIPVYRILHQGKDQVGETAQEDHRYPFAGQPNASVRLGVVPSQGGETVWLDLGGDPDFYLARVDWLPDGALAAQVENRAQTQLDLLRFDPPSWAPRRLLRETSAVWINLHDLFCPLKSAPYAGGFIWGSERSGFRHLYLYDNQARLVRPLTAGEWLVDSLAGVDEAAGLVYFTASADGPTESHLYAVSLEGGAPRRLTQAPGLHLVTLDHGFRRFIDVHHSLAVQPNVTLRSLADGARLATLYDRPDPRAERLALQPPELVTLTSRDGVPLYGLLYRPPAEFGPGPYPTLVQVYGGPHAQLAANGWNGSANLSAQLYRRLGFLVFCLDNRGSARRGLAFEGALRWNMGGIEVQDQVDGVRWLVAQGLADPARVGISGWSYGGYMAAMCLGRTPETFRAAVAGSPVSAWDGYDTHYTERYMGTPQDNPQGYAEASLLSHVQDMQGSLLIVHGLIDENVHFRHTARLVNALIQARKPYRLLLFPDERHTPRRLEDRVYLHEQVLRFLWETLRR